MKSFSLWLFLASISLSALSQQVSPGQIAPELKVGEWVKGEPVSAFEKDKIYVIEFWATWCGPCKKSIPHLTKLAARFKKDVTFIGVSIAEMNTSAVEPFVKRMGDQMAYNVAIDAQESPVAGYGFMAKNWLEAAGLVSIPVAFVVGKKGTIEFIGSTEDLETVLEKIIADRWDAKAHNKKWRAKLRRRMNA